MSARMSELLLLLSLSLLLLQKYGVISINILLPLSVEWAIRLERVYWCGLIEFFANFDEGADVSLSLAYKLEIRFLNFIHWPFDSLVPWWRWRQKSYLLLPYIQQINIWIFLCDLWQLKFLRFNRLIRVYSFRLLSDMFQLRQRPESFLIFLNCVDPINLFVPTTRVFEFTKCFIDDGYRVILFEHRRFFSSIVRQSLPYRLIWQCDGHC